MMRDDNTIRLLLNGEALTVAIDDPTLTVLQWLRERRALVGTKEGCAEGDCGACTVVVGEREGDRLVMRPVNACIRFLPTLDGKALYTVEHLRDADGVLHPVQQCLVTHHGSQCGFCTPGFVMSLWASCLDVQDGEARPDRRALAHRISGNLCRCTGYRPILDAAEAVFDETLPAFDRGAVLDALDALRDDGALVVELPPVPSEDVPRRYFAPRSLDALLALRAAYPDATLLAGGTDVGLWVNKALRCLPVIIATREVEALRVVERGSDGGLRIGAGVDLERAYRAAREDHPELGGFHERFASRPIREAGTLGGNVVNGSPIGDSLPWLLALDAELELAGAAGRRRLAIDRFYLDYRVNALEDDEVLLAIELPPRPDGLRFRTWKVAKRHDQDISAVCAAIAFGLDDDGCVSRPRLAFGGMAATARRATAAEAALEGAPWTEASVRAAMKALEDDFRPLDDVRASARYRLRVAGSLLYRCWLETRVRDPLPADATSVYASFAGAA